LEQHCEIIFEEQLGGWWTDERSWPPNRGIEVFQEWFECRLHSMVLDLDDEPLSSTSDRKIAALGSSTIEFLDSARY
jgi:hypothetical protein